MIGAWVFLGLIVGIVFSSLLWGLYIIYWIEDAAAMSRKVRRWINKLPD